MLRNEMPVPFLYPASSLATEISERMRTGSTGEWTQREVLQAITDALSTWAGRVKVLFAETVPVSSSGVVEVPYYVGTARFSDWQSVIANGKLVSLSKVQRATDGGRSAYIAVPGGTTEVVITWLEEASCLLPSVQMSLSSELSDDGNMLTVSPGPILSHCGFVKIDDEYMSYQGLSYNGASLSLLNLGRGLRGSSAATHVSGSALDICVPIPSFVLFSHLVEKVRANLHALPLNVTSIEEREAHTLVMRYSQQLADEAWSTYVSQTGAYGPRTLSIESIRALT